jgi:hypothetical protein
MKVSLVEGVVCEKVGSDLIVMAPGSDTVVSVTGDAAVLLESLNGSSGVEVEQSVTVDELIVAGVLRPEFESTGVSRRGLLVGSAGVAGAGVLALSMPSAAMASSEDFLAGEWFYFLSAGVLGFEATLPLDSPLQENQTFRLIPDDGGFGITLKAGESDVATVENGKLYWDQPFTYGIKPPNLPGSTLTGTIQEVNGSRTFRVRFTFTE